MAKKRRNRKVIPFQHERTLTYNKAKPNRQARRLGIKPEEPKREEKKTVSKAAVLSQKAKQARETQRRITPPGMTYGEYMEYLKDKRQQLVKKIHKKHTDNRVKELIAQGVDKEIAKVMASVGL